ncbi:Gfo/Idh/MocA family protein [Devosia sp. ZW T5_3]|uniref:Gfo/Idh/MocA family protein n=1 Tax=Devosia sp. ZW T5_3 TaxID=3378085 RepID=UPI003854CEEE
MTTGLRWALIGASTIARERIVAAIRAAGGNIVAVQSGNLERAEAFAADFALPLATQHLAEAVANADAVYISSTNAQHCAQTLQALDTGCHVLCEKPIAIDLADARRMIAAAGAAGRILAVNHHLRHNAVHRKIRDCIVSGQIGTPRAVIISNAGWLPGHLRGWRLSGPGAGIVLDKTVHDIDLLRFLLASDPRSVSAAFSGPNGEPPHAIMGILDFGPTLSAQFHDDFDAPFGQTRLEVIGDAGRLIAEDCLSGRPAGSLTLHDQSGPHILSIAHHDPYAALIDNFQQAARNGAPIAASGRDGAIALATALAAIQSATTGSRTQIENLP